ncbi:hypothetical protein [Deinococcus pimensis]|uniref:hypothetical protein n=1 Tax=Deinococcus pimensis TaxID=309888 RepID=UPI0004832BF7|nr:hypothetical protein [Deinococcus pimensis]
MTDDKLSDIPPLGRSAEEVEADAGNRVNPPSTREDHAGDQTIAPLPIANPGSQGVPGNFTSGSAPIIGVLGVGGRLHDDVNDHRDRTDEDATDNGEA